MSFSNYLAESRSPKQKLVEAVYSNDVDLLQRLLEEGIDIQGHVHKYGDDTLLHRAATRGHYRCIELLAKAGADCDVPNAFGITPIFNAARRHHWRATYMLLKHSKSILGLPMLWYDGKWTEFLHNSATDHVLAVLITATPDLNVMLRNLCSNILFRCIERNYLQSLYMFFLSGYRSDLGIYRVKVSDTIAKLRAALEDGVVPYKPACLKSFQVISGLLNRQTPHSLQHLCRLSIRTSFHGNCNAYYGAEQLQELPHTLRKYIVFQSDPETESVLAILASLKPK